MGHALDDFRAKIRHGNEHLQALDESIERWKRRDPYAVIHEKDLQAAKYEVVLRLYEPPPVGQWALMLGDCVHAYRSALDHLVWALAVDEQSRHWNEPRRQTEFPVFVDAADYARKAQQKVSDISGNARTVIERLQPYNGTYVPNEGHPLWVVHELDRLDKHRNLNVVALSTQSARLSVDWHHSDIEMRGGIDSPLSYQALKDGAYLAGLDFVVTGPDPQVDMEVEVTIDVALGEEGTWQGWALIPTLRSIRNHIVTEVEPAVRSLL